MISFDRNWLKKMENIQSHFLAHSEIFVWSLFEQICQMDWTSGNETFQSISIFDSLAVILLLKMTSLSKFSRKKWSKI